MSGGALDYSYSKIQYSAETLESYLNGFDTEGFKLVNTNINQEALLRDFVKHLFECADILRKIEWDFSGDSSLTKEDYETIRSTIFNEMQENRN